MEALQLGGVDELDTIPSDDESYSSNDDDTLFDDTGRQVRVTFAGMKPIEAYSSNDDTLFDDTGRQVRVTFAGMKRIEAFCSPIRASSHSKKKFKVA